MRSPTNFAAFLFAASCCGSLAAAQTTIRPSVRSNGVQASQHSFLPSVSNDGRWIAFESYAADYVAGDVNGVEDIFVHDRVSGATVCVSVTPGGAPGNAKSDDPSISGDGRYVAFDSQATNLVPMDTNGWADEFVRDLQAGTTTRASVGPGGVQAVSYSAEPCMSADGRFVAFSSAASNLAPGEGDLARDVFVRDLLTGVTVRASIAWAGAETGQDCTTTTGHRFLSGDGRFVCFSSGAADLVPNDNNLAWDVFVRDLQLGTTERVSVNSFGVEGDNSSGDAGISDDGRFVSFSSAAQNLVGGDSFAIYDAFLHDRATGQTSCVTVDPQGVPRGGGRPAVSGDGKWVSFASDATGLVPGDTNGESDVFLRDLTAQTTRLLGVSTTGAQADDSSFVSCLSFDGRFAVFDSYASNLVAGDTNGYADCFLVDAQTDAPVSAYCTAKVDSSGCTPAIGASGFPSLTGFDSFVTTATAVLPQKNGVFFWGTAPAAIPFGGGTLCVQPPLVRSTLLSSGGAAACSGAFAYPFRQAYMLQKGIQAGDTLHGQFWSRDPGFPPPDNVGLSDALTFTVVP